jgi:hypothetical protein
VAPETEIERTDLETIINDCMTGQFNDPVRVVAFNTLEHWADDVSDDVAAEIQTAAIWRGSLSRNTSAILCRTMPPEIVNSGVRGTREAADQAHRTMYLMLTTIRADLSTGWTNALDYLRAVEDTDR